MSCVPQTPEGAVAPKPPWWRLWAAALVLLPAGTFLGTYSYLIAQAIQWTQNSLLPHQLEAMRLAPAGSVPPKLLLRALLAAAVVGVAAAFWAHPDIHYRSGAASARARPWLTDMGRQPWVLLARWLRDPAPPDLNGLAGVGAGALVVCLLAGLQRRNLWWPLHPVGYVLGSAPSMISFCCPFFLAWLRKLAVLRLGGIRLYRRCLPFALGLILGDYVVPALWGLVGLATDTQMYLSFP